MKFQKLMFLFTLVLVVSLGYSCGDDDEAMTDPADCSIERSYSSDVVPILNQTCAIPNCHVNNFLSGDYTMYQDLADQNNMGLLSIQIETGAMPPSNTAGPTELTDDEKAIFLCWIEQGALDN